MTRYFCNHCGTYFNMANKGDIVCPRCGIGVVCENGILIHPANKVMSIEKAREIISWLGWRDFKKAQLSFALDHPELRPKKRG